MGQAMMRAHDLVASVRGGAGEGFGAQGYPHRVEPCALANRAVDMHPPDVRGDADRGEVDMGR